MTRHTVLVTHYARPPPKSSGDHHACGLELLIVETLDHKAARNVAELLKWGRRLSTGCSTSSHVRLAGC